MANNSVPLEAVRLLHDGATQATGRDAIAEAARLLTGGEVVAIPTDTVYGLAAALDQPAALREIFRIKGRPPDRSLPVLLADATTARRLRRSGARPETGWREGLAALAERFWPGALTIAVPAGPGLPPEVLASDDTVGLRVPDSVIARDVIERAGGALAVTSANRSGHPPALDAATMLDQAVGVTPALRWILDGGPGVLGVPSTVVGQDGTRLVIHRSGAIDAAELRRVWESR